MKRSQNSVNNTTDNIRSTFVLVHSAWTGAWEWGAVTPLLDESGQNAVAFDLPGHGEDTTPVSDITLDSYVQKVVDILDQQSEPVVLVGHSFAGIIISQAAELRPEKVKSLVYLCAFLLPNGVSFLNAIEGVEGSVVLDNLVFSEDGLTVIVNEEKQYEAFVHDIPEETFMDAQPNLVPEPTAPLGVALSITEENWGVLPRYYMECLQDNAIPNGVQKAMYTAIPVEKVFSLDTSHLPNFSVPDKVVENLLEIAQIKE